MKLRKICSVALAVILSVSTCGVTAFAEVRYNCDYIYDMLETEAEREFYDTLLENCRLVDESDGFYDYTPYTPYPAGITFSRARELALLFGCDHPEFFWIDSEIRFSMLFGVSFKVNDSFADGQERKLGKQLIESAARLYIDKAEGLADDYSKAKFLQDALLSTVEYEEGEWDQSIASVFLQRKTVCAGFSKAYEYLCNAVGIDSLVLTSVGHAWNAVKIDGNWYLADVTNDRKDYRFFLISASRMREIDKGLSTRYQESRVEDGNEKIYTFYMHEVDYLDYSNYANKLPQCVYTFGDANRDNLRNVRDAAYIARMLAEGRGGQIDFRGDFNLDGKINVRDAAALAKELA